jgi:hypothetical protein
MLSTQTKDLLRHLRGGHRDTADTTWLEQTRAAELVAELSSVYRWTFQERRLKSKWEVSLARAYRIELAVRRIPDSVFVSFALVPTYRDCLLLSAEGDRVTGISRLSRLTLRVIRKPTPGLAVTTWGGFKLDRGPDGWALTRMNKRTVKLSESFLRDRGWQFDHLSKLALTP